MRQKRGERHKKKTYVDIVQDKGVLILLEITTVVGGVELFNLSGKVLCVVVMGDSFDLGLWKFVEVVLMFLALLAANDSLADMGADVEFVVAEEIPEFNFCVAAGKFVEGDLEIDVEFGLRVGIENDVGLGLADEIGPDLAEKNGTNDGRDEDGEKAAAACRLCQVDGDLAEKVDGGEVGHGERWRDAVQGSGSIMRCEDNIANKLFRVGERRKGTFTSSR